MLAAKRNIINPSLSIVNFLYTLADLVLGFTSRNIYLCTVKWHIIMMMVEVVNSITANTLFNSL